MKTSEEIVHFIQQNEYKALAKLLREDSSVVPIFLQEFYSLDCHSLQAMSKVLDVFKPDYTSIFEPYYQEWIEQIDQSNDDAFLRNSFRFFQDVSIPNEVQGKLYSLAFDVFKNPKQAIAIRVFAMTTCMNIAKNYPDLLQETKIAIESLSTQESPAMRSRARSLLSQL